MIYVNEETMEIDDFDGMLMENCFYKAKDDIVFSSEKVSDGYYLCIRLSPSYNSKGRQVRDINVEVLAEHGLSSHRPPTSKEKKDAIYSLMYALSYAYSVHDVFFFEECIPIIEEYTDDMYVDVDKASITAEFMDTFAMVGDVFEGFYEGNLILGNLKLINSVTGQEIKEYQNVNISSSFFIEEDDDMDYMIECFIESMSQFDLKELIEKSIGKIKETTSCFR